jgi:hypothetical protein
MKRFVRWFIGALVVLAVIFIGGAYVLPDRAEVARQAVIAAPPEKIFAIVGDLRRFNEFSPWADLDPGTKYSFENEAPGIGQTMSWISADPNVGSGSQRVTAYEPHKHVAVALDFGEMGQAESAFDLAPAGANTSVTWSFRAPLTNPMDRWMGLMFDRWIGADYEKGLVRLKAAAEKP